MGRDVTICGTVVHQHFHGVFTRLRDATIDLDPLPGDHQLVDPMDRRNLLGCFTGRDWLLEQIDEFLAECLRDRLGGYLFIEAGAGMGKSALATYLAFTRDWPTHVTRLPGGTSPETARTNLVAQLIARWSLADAAPDGVLPADHDTTAWLYKQICQAARHRDDTDPAEPVVLLVDGLDEAPPPVPGELPLGLPMKLPAGTVVIATTRPGVLLPFGLGTVRRIDVESQLNRDDLLAYLLRITERDTRLAAAIASAGMTPVGFCRRLQERAGGVWIYASSVLDQIREGRSASDVETLPSGLAGYYAANIARWQADTTISWDTVGLPLLGMLAAMREPQTAAVMAQWASLPVAVVKSLLRGPLKPFLVTRPGGDPDVYALRHQSLRELCEGRIPPDTDDHLRELSHDLGEATRIAHGQIMHSLVPAGTVRTVTGAYMENTKTFRVNGQLGLTWCCTLTSEELFMIAVFRKADTGYHSHIHTIMADGRQGHEVIDFDGDRFTAYLGITALGDWSIDIYTESYTESYTEPFWGEEWNWTPLEIV